MNIPSRRLYIFFLSLVGGTSLSRISLSLPMRRGHLTGQLHEFSIVQTNVQTTGEAPKKDEDGNYRAHWRSWSVHQRRCRDVLVVLFALHLYQALGALQMTLVGCKKECVFRVRVIAWAQFERSYAQQQLSSHILTRPTTAKHTTDWIHRSSMQTRAVLSGRWGWWCWFTGRRGRSRWTSTRSSGVRASCIPLRCIILVVLCHLTCLPFFELG